MVEPVTTADGYTFEKYAIKQWLLNKGVSPITNLPLKNKDLIENRALKEAIIFHRQREEQAQAQAKKALIQMYKNFCDLFPALMDSSGFISPDKVILLIMEYQEMRKSLMSIKESISTFEPISFEAQNIRSKIMESIGNCSSLSRSNFNLAEVNCEWSEIPFVNISSETLHQLDFKVLSQDDFHLESVRNYSQSSENMNEFLTRIKIMNSIPLDHNLVAYRYKGTAQSLYSELMRKVSTCGCDMSITIEAVGDKLSG